MKKELKENKYDGKIKKDRRESSVNNEIHRRLKIRIRFLKQRSARRPVTKPGNQKV